MTVDTMSAVKMAKMAVGKVKCFQFEYRLLCFFFYFFFVKQFPGWGPEWREPNKAVLCPLIIILLISYIIIYLKLLVMENHPSPNRKRNFLHLLSFCVEQKVKRPICTPNLNNLRLSGACVVYRLLAKCSPGSQWAERLRCLQMHKWRFQSREEVGPWNGDKKTWKLNAVLKTNEYIFILKTSLKYSYIFSGGSIW